MITLDSNDDRRGSIKRLGAFPSDLRAVVDGITDEYLEYSYRPGGWTIRQIIHHLADGHANWYCRMRWVVSEDTPTIKTYDENAYARIEDASTGPIEPSLSIIEGLHARLVDMLDKLPEADWHKTGFHPEANQHLSLQLIASTLAWHGEHHLIQIKQALEKRITP